MNHDPSRLDRQAISRRSLNGILLGGSAGAFALAANAASPRSDSASALSAGTVEDHLAIEELVYRYAIAVDSLDTAGLVDLFAADSPQRAGLNAGIEYHRQYEHTIHHVQNHVHTVRGNTATGVTYCMASMVKRGESGLTKFDVYFRYRDELVKQSYRWFFVKREFDILFSSEAMPVQPGAPLLGGQVKPGSFRTPPLLGPRL